LKSLLIVERSPEPEVVEERGNAPATPSSSSQGPATSSSPSTPPDTSSPAGSANTGDSGKKAKVEPEECNEDVIVRVLSSTFKYMLTELIE
jgi:hypothetical protein